MQDNIKLSPITEKRLNTLCDEKNSTTKKSNTTDARDITSSKKSQHIDNSNKENLQPIKSTIPINNTPLKEDVQSQIDSQIEDTPTYNVLTRNKYTPLNEITDLMETDTNANDNNSIVAELKNRNRLTHPIIEAPSIQDKPFHDNTTQKGINVHPGPSNITISREDDKDRPKGKDQKKKEKPPPLNIIYQNPKDAERLITSQIKEANFTIKRINNNKHILQMFSLTDFHKAKKLLKSVYTCFYNFTQKKDKAISVLLKGLHHSYDPKAILSKLKSLKVKSIGFHKVTLFKTKRSVSENIQLLYFWYSWRQEVKYKIFSK